MTDIENTYAEIEWTEPRTLANRNILICFNGKCMTGRIEKIDLIKPGKCLISLRFIESSYFDLKPGNRITLQEASEILAEGIIMKMPE
jgi:hypothetical protein